MDSETGNETLLLSLSMFTSFRSGIGKRGREKKKRIKQRLSFQVPMTTVLNLNLMNGVVESME